MVKALFIKTVLSRLTNFISEVWVYFQHHWCWMV